jgi:hypothetical protein
MSTKVSEKTINLSYSFEFLLYVHNVKKLTIVTYLLNKRSLKESPGYCI